MPIRPNYGQPDEPMGHLNIDYSFLLHDYDQRTKIKATASNKDAKLLMDIWLHANKTKEDTYQIHTGNRDIMRLKTLGFITGGTDEVKFTAKGKMIIKTMALGEPNQFDKEKKEKSYTEILASMKPEGKTGLRDPRFASNHNVVLDLTKLEALNEKNTGK